MKKRKKSRSKWLPKIIACSECGMLLMPRSRRQVTCGSRACKLARIKRLALGRPESHRVPTLFARAKERRMQRSLEEAMYGIQPNIIDQCPFQ